jgi:guanine deaminase
MKRYMEMALKEAEEGIRKGEAPFGACIVKGKDVLSVAHNTVLSKKDPTNHAEVNAIRMACRKLGKRELRGCTVYSTTEPCPMCFSAIHWAKMSKIVFGTRIADVKNIGFSELTVSNRMMKREGGSKVSIKADFMRRECLELLQLWRRIRGNPY